jgi:hypothetical protein
MQHCVLRDGCGVWHGNESREKPSGSDSAITERGCTIQTGTERRRPVEAVSRRLNRREMPENPRARPRHSWGAEPRTPGVPGQEPGNERAGMSALRACRSRAGPPHPVPLPPRRWERGLEL